MKLDGDEWEGAGVGGVGNLVKALISRDIILRIKCTRKRLEPLFVCLLFINVTSTTRSLVTTLGVNESWK